MLYFEVHKKMKNYKFFIRSLNVNRCQFLFIWQVDKSYTHTDEQGWSYGVDFGTIMSNYRKGKSSSEPFGAGIYALHLV